ncbi:MAG: hypothetical protein QF415_03415 [Candidatus Undinarchaeales archaeon]|jgi:hypothetical protein|nr:hypothetical protein [Candidatus Undinarchaeales archaeon]MDP7494390.1 hypothetical protein [Candidatus Undinarchaeales archaeon]
MHPPLEADKETWEFEWNPKRRFEEYCKLVEAYNGLRKHNKVLEVKYEEMKQLMLELRDQVDRGTNDQQKLFDRLNAIKTIATPKDL